MLRRVKNITYNRKEDIESVYNRFREEFLNIYFPGSRIAEHFFWQDVEKLSANYSRLFMFQYALWSRYWFHRHIYRSVVLTGERDQTFESIRQASVEGALFYMPNHQAHIDSMVISWVAKRLRVPQPMFIAWNTLARRRSSYLMPLVNSCLLDRQVMDNRFRPMDEFRNSRNYRAGYATLFTGYLERMLSNGVDTLIYPEGGRSYSGRMGDARIKRVFKTVKKVQASLEGTRRISVVPVALSFSLVPEAGHLIRAYYKKSFLPPSSLFHDMQDGDDRYAAFRPQYRVKTSHPFIKAYIEKRIPIFCVMGHPIPLKDHPGIGLEECFDVVRKNRKILPPHFMARLLLSDPAGIAGKWKNHGAEGLVEPARSLRGTLSSSHLDNAYFSDDTLADILSIGMEYFQCGKTVSGKGEINDYPLLEYYANKCIPGGQDR